MVKNEGRFQYFKMKFRKGFVLPTNNQYIVDIKVDCIIFRDDNFVFAEKIIGV